MESILQQHHIHRTKNVQWNHTAPRNLTTVVHYWKNNLDSQKTTKWCTFKHSTNNVSTNKLKNPFEYHHIKNATSHQHLQHHPRRTKDRPADGWQDDSQQSKIVQKKSVNSMDRLQKGIWLNPHDWLKSLEIHKFNDVILNFFKTRMTKWQTKLTLTSKNETVITEKKTISNPESSKGISFRISLHHVFSLSLGSWKYTSRTDQPSLIHGRSEALRQYRQQLENTSWSCPRIQWRRLDGIWPGQMQ